MSDARGVGEIATGHSTQMFPASRTLRPAEPIPHFALSGFQVRGIAHVLRVGMARRGLAVWASMMSSQDSSIAPHARPSLSVLRSGWDRRGIQYLSIKTM